jgi:geranylgeranyl reductase family protein
MHDAVGIETAPRNATPLERANDRAFGVPRAMTSDVAIVGGGPAGAWAALLLAKGGARVTLFDHSHPREKPCGGGLTARALEIVRPALSPARCSMVVADSARFTADTTLRHAVVPLDTNPAGRRESLVIASRRELDRALLESAISRGVRHVSERIVDVQIGSNEVLLRSASGKYRAALVIGADGANSLVRRRVHRAFHRSQLSVATGFFVSGATAHDIRIHCVSRPGGYIWSFPRRDHLAVGICANAAHAPAPEALRAIVNGWIDETRIAAGAPLRAYAWPIPTLSATDLAQEVVGGPRWLLAGDAAGLVDPLTREGIYFALKSAEYASEAVLMDGDPSRRYTERVRETLHPELGRAAFFARGFFQPGFMRLLIHALAESERTREVMRDLVAGHQPYRGLEWRLLATLELGLAARLVALKLGLAGQRAR